MQDPKTTKRRKLKEIAWRNSHQIRAMWWREQKEESDKLEWLGMELLGLGLALEIKEAEEEEDSSSCMQEWKWDKRENGVGWWVLWKEVLKIYILAQLSEITEFD